jgi:hypothetical protein
MNDVQGKDRSRLRLDDEADGASIASLRRRWQPQTSKRGEQAMTRGVVVAALVATCVVVGPAQGAGASADSHASCLGLALSDHGPAGEMPGELDEAKALADKSGLTFGALVSGAAHFLPGSHATCEEAQG